MREHGDYRIELMGNVLHVYPFGGFNEFGIAELHREIRQVAPTNVPWVLIEHPKDVAGVTPEALEAIGENYSNLSQIGCVAIGLEIARVWAFAINNATQGRVNIPVYFDSDPYALQQSVCAHL